MLVELTAVKQLIFIEVSLLLELLKCASSAKKISYAGYLGLNPAISFRLKCALQPKIAKKITKNPF